MNKKGFFIIFNWEILKWALIIFGIIFAIGFIADLYDSYDININPESLKPNTDIFNTKENYTEVYLRELTSNLSKLNSEYSNMNCNGVVSKENYSKCIVLYNRISNLTDEYNSIKNGSFTPVKKEEIIEKPIEKPFIEIEKTENYNNSLTRTLIDENYDSTDYELSKGPKIEITELEKEIHRLINIERKQFGLRELNYDDKLSNIARKHSTDMGENNFFDHDNLKGEDPTDRANKAGYRCYKDYGSYYTEGIAENIFQMSTYSSCSYYYDPNNCFDYEWYSSSEIANEVVQGWMNSPGHRENILTKEYDKEGIGISITNDQEIYVTENFC